jgi:hypothetical protein
MEMPPAFSARHLFFRSQGLIEPGMTAGSSRLLAALAAGGLLLASLAAPSAAHGRAGALGFCMVAFHPCPRRARLLLRLLDGDDFEVRGAIVSPLVMLRPAHCRSRSVTLDCRWHFL